MHRRLADEDDELSEVQPDAVPPEVREWLASTFTRQLATAKRKSDEKPKFRSVAHAIRAGIFVDRIYRRVTSTALMQFPQDVVRVLKVSNFNFLTVFIKLSVSEIMVSKGILKFCKMFLQADVSFTYNKILQSTLFIWNLICINLNVMHSDIQPLI